MSDEIPPLDLQPGDLAVTDYNSSFRLKALGRETLTVVTITGRRNATGCQSGVLYQVEPLLKNGDRNSWYDAAWFKRHDARANGEAK